MTGKPGQDFLRAIETEQKRIGQDLHDDLCQQLTAITLLSQVLEKKLSDKSLAEAADAEEIRKRIAETIVHTRLLAKGLLPVELESGGLLAALAQLAANIQKLTHISCRAKGGTTVSILDRKVAINLYRIAQEAVANAVKHSQAKHIIITLSEKKDHVILSVADDGVGIAKGVSDRGGLGLSIMNSRAKTINATLDVRRGPKGGTVATCTLRSQASPDRRGAGLRLTKGRHENLSLS